MKGLRVLRGQIVMILLLNSLTFLFLSITLDQINPQNNIKLPKEPRSQDTLCNIDP